MLRKDSWKRWEEAVVEIYSAGLLRLLRHECLPENEDEISRKLFFEVLEARREWCERNNHNLEGHPIIQSKIQPDPADKDKQSRENKVPDFIWRFTDYNKRVDKSYTIECKRLGDDKYRFCSEYVVNGIKRFIDEEWGYGYSCESGLMIGYIQSLTLAEILKWVNHYAGKQSVPSLNLNGEWLEKGVSRLENHFMRPVDSTTSFRLRHLWADLRWETQQAISTKASNT